MDEYQLIEIAKRFRVLEDRLEDADLFLASFAERCKKRIATAEADQVAGKLTYGAYCARVNEPAADLTNLTEVRGDIEKHLQSCRDDMTAMQEALRKCGGVK